MKISRKIRYFVLFLACLSLSQQAAKEDKTLSLNQTFDLYLSENESVQYTLTIPQIQHKNSDLYIHAMPKYSDPFEVPYLTIKSDNNFTQECFSAAAEFAGVCHISSKELVENRTFSLQVKCASSCDLTFHIYENSNVVLQLGQSLKLTGYGQAGLTQIVGVQVPKGVTFTGLAVMAVILNLEENIQMGDQGVDLYVNYGNGTLDNLEENQFKIRGESLNGGGKGAFIYSNQIGSEGTIKCMVKIKKDVSIRFSVISMNDKQLNIDLGKSYFDYVNNQTPKMYTLNTSAYSLNTNNKTLSIVFDIYSGSPDFLISFDPNFNKIIEYNRKASAISVLLAPEIRKSFNFTDMIYIKVTSEFASQFYFYTNFIRNDVTFIEPYYAYLDQIPPKGIQNYIMTENYKFPQGSNDTYKNYSFKIEMFEGFGKFYFKRCKEYEKKSQDNPSFKQCLVNNESYFTTKEFFDEQIQNKHILAGNLLTITMLHDVSQCTQISRKQGFVITKCVYLISVVGQSQENFQFSLLPERNYFVNYLRQNKIIKQYIPKNNYAFYVFSLPQISSVTEINIFVTTFSGDTALIVSSTDKLPTLQTNSNKIIKQSGAKNNIVLKKDQLTPQIYISVFAYQFTQINIGVIVHRNGSNASSVHYLPLNEDNIQTYIINKTQPSVYFRFSSKNATQISVLANQLQGHIEILVLDSTDKHVTCINQSENPLICKFYPQTFSNYTVKVFGDPKQQSKFAITYKTQKRTCFSGKLNQPLYVTLESKVHQCYSFNVNRQIFIIFAASFTHLQMFDQQIKVKLLINQKEYANINGPHKVITVEDMVQYCPMGLSLDEFPATCELTIDFTSNVDTTSYFSFIMEEQDAEIALFDGVSQRIKGKSIQMGSSKNFYYAVSTDTSIQIFFTSKSLNLHYFYAAKFVSRQVFLSRNRDNNNIYLQYVPQIDRPRQNVSINRNYFSGVIKEIGLQRLVIDSSSIRKYCITMDCYMIISIYPQYSNEGSRISEDQYQIQVSQEETYLALGDSKIGMLNKAEIYTYLVDPQDAFIEFKLVDSNGIDSLCLSAQAASANGTIVKGKQLTNNLQVSKDQKIQRIYVKGLKDGCSFQIKYISNKNPFQNVQIAHPYDIKVSNGDTVRFIYYHPHPRPFRIIQMVSSGQPSIFVKPIAENTLKLSSLDTLSYSQFPSFAQYQGEYSIETTNSHFCSSCYYYVVITTKNKFVGQVLFLRASDPIPLSSKHIFKHTLQPKIQRSQERFVFYSLTNAKINFNVLSGRLKINIKDPQGNVVVQQQITEETSFKIKSLVYKDKQKVQYYSEKAKFQVTLSTKQETEYYIQLNKNQISTRIFQGFPSKILIQDVMPQTVQFINSQSLDKPLNLMIDLIGQDNADVNLTFIVTAENKDGRTIQSQKIIRNITKSEDTYSISINNMDARYFLAIITNIPVNITILLVKTSLIYISPMRNYLFQHEGVYQIYSNNRNVLVEVFACQGQISLIGSRQQKQMAFDYQGSGSISIRKPNYGGHYVFGIETDFPSYFVRITNKFSDQPLEYLINYFYYDTFNPYDAIDAPNYEIQYEIWQEGIYVSVKPVQLMEPLNSTISIKEIQYIIYASTSKYDLNRYSRCSINGNVVKKSSIDPNITIDYKTLSQLFSTNLTERLFVTVQASISIQMAKSNKSSGINFPTTTTLFYNIAQVYTKDIRVSSVSQMQSSKAYWFTDSLYLFLGWMLLLTFISIVIPYVLLKVCIRKLMMRQQNMVQDVEMVSAPNQNQTRPTEEKINVGSATNIPFPSSQPIIKESI